MRTPLFAVNVQWMHPDFASSEYTVPFWLPTNSRPLATVGCDQAEVASGKPNAHFNESFGTSSAVRPACFVDCSRVLVSDGDHAVHDGDASGSVSGGDDVQRPTDAPVMSPPGARPVMNSATARRSAPLRRPPCGRIPPAVSAARIASGDRWRMTSSFAARDSAAPS